MEITSEIPALFSGRRYHVYNDWVKIAHGGRVQKVSIDAGFTCPNRDGTRGIGLQGTTILRPRATFHRLRLCAINLRIDM